MTFKSFIGKWVLSLLPFLLTFISQAQNDTRPGLRDEHQVKPYLLPDLWLGIKPKSTNDQLAKQATWNQLVRPKLIQQFEEELYGAVPKSGYTSNLEKIKETQTDWYKLTQYQIRITHTAKGQVVTALIAVFSPKDRTVKGLIAGLNFCGNHTVTLDPAILLSDSWVDWNGNYLIKGKATDASRGVRQHRWPIHLALQQGYAVATSCYQDWEPDTKKLPTGFPNTGLRKLFSPDTNFGAITAWAFGLQQVVSNLRAEPGLQGKPAYVIGHSRLGKAALWATALDTSIAGCLANGSGRFGASITRRHFGESSKRIITQYPYWFNPRRLELVNSVDSIPKVDQHQLLALVAPRLLMIGSALGDWWADPKGEWLSLAEASTIWQLFNKGETLPKNPAQPPKNQLFRNVNQAYHLRQGEHDITYLEWQQFLSLLP